MKYIVEKRDGALVDFQIEKICSVIKKAFGSLHKEWDDSVIELLALRVTADFDSKRDGNRIHVEQIQDSVEKVLSESGYTEVSKAYILYRKQRENVRRLVTKMQDHSSLIASYLSDERHHGSWSNAEMIREISADLIRSFWNDEIYDEEIRNALKEGQFRICDPDSLLMYEKTIPVSGSDSLSQMLDLISTIDQALRNCAGRICLQTKEPFLCKEEIAAFFKGSAVRFAEKETKNVCVRAEVFREEGNTLELAHRTVQVRRQVLVQLAQAGFFPHESSICGSAAEICFCTDHVPAFEKQPGFVYTRAKALDGSQVFDQLDHEMQQLQGKELDRIAYEIQFEGQAQKAAAEVLLQTLYSQYPFVNEFVITTKQTG